MCPVRSVICSYPVSHQLYAIYILMSIAPMGSTYSNPRTPDFSYICSDPMKPQMITTVFDKTSFLWSVAKASHKGVFTFRQMRNKINYICCEIGKSTFFLFLYLSVLSQCISSAVVDIEWILYFPQIINDSWGK